MKGLSLAVIVSVCVGVAIASILPPNYMSSDDDGSNYPLGPGEGGMYPGGPGGPMGPDDGMYQMGPGGEGGMITMGPRPIGPGYPGSMDDDQVPVMSGQVGAGFPGVVVNGQFPMGYPGLVKKSHVPIKYPGHTRHGFMATVVSANNGHVKVIPRIPRPNVFYRPGQVGTTVVSPGQIGSTFVRTGLTGVVGHQGPVLYPTIGRKVVYPVMSRPGY
ncbi:collagen alpha-1(VIII) chain-like [Argopecten irradians]|uniref:collagen alpha-1(VIII) chain-like n=1 Tax=Argopecten irradians TaxID=31199 RepID=UPI0037215322